VVIGRKNVLAHRRSHELFIGPVPDGMMVLHSCDVRECVNPSHLRAGSAADNGDDMAVRGRAHFHGATHCANGHPFDEANTYRSTQRGRERRACKVCRRAARQRHEASHQSA
jgi:hypothetical protein